MKREYHFLGSIIVLACIIRILFIWVGRPEFVGWFNHTYYYYVQTMGIVENGTMPFDDMPFLFYLYALTSKFLVSLGMDVRAVVVSSSRFWMVLIPSLIPIPVFRILKATSPRHEMPVWGWVFVIVSAFYPLSLLYLPEFLQKNALGLLLLAILMNQSIKILRDVSVKNVIIFIAIFLLTVITHYGTTGVALLYCAALAFSIILLQKQRVGFKVAAGAIGGLVIALFVFRLFDVQRLERVGFYIRRTIDTSSLGVIFSNTTEAFDKIMGLLMIMLPIGMLWFFYRLFRKNQSRLPFFIKAFWLSTLIFSYLLVLPIYDQLLLGRFSLYLTLALAFVLFLTLQYAAPKLIIRRIVLGLSLAGVLLIAFGELMSRTFHNRNKEDVFADIVALKEEISLNENDLIIARNGVEHISNWFLGTRSCIITSFNQNDFDKYDRVFILNPSEAGMIIQGKPNEGINRYNLMLGNVPVPENGETVYSTQTLNLIKVSAPPDEWIFDDEGRWVEYKIRTD